MTLLNKEKMFESEDSIKEAGILYCGIIFGHLYKIKDELSYEQRQDLNEALDFLLDLFQKDGRLRREIYYL